jgi:hypothetical protein
MVAEAKYLAWNGIAANQLSRWQDSVQVSTSNRSEGVTEAQGTMSITLLHVL